MYQEGGLRSLYRGTVATLARDIPGSAAYFVAYEWVYRALKPKDGNMSVGAVLFAGGEFQKKDLYLDLKLKTLLVSKTT
jgi:solute carrier family 25 carnitine/acylcarnitine transporter 20/29